jgi:hypothetical protein
MAEVIIAPARRLHQTPQTSINDQSYLPTGAEQAVIRQRLNDDEVINMDDSYSIPDSKQRNEVTRQQHFWYSPRSLIGKHSSILKPLVNDQTAMQNYTTKNIARTSRDEYVDYRLRCCNLVAMPFTTADTMVYDSEGIVPNENVE